MLICIFCCVFVSLYSIVFNCLLEKIKSVEDFSAEISISVSEVMSSGCISAEKF